MNTINKKIYASWFVLAFISIVPLVYKMSDLSALLNTYIAISIIYNILYPVVILLLIKYMALSDGLLKSEKPISMWGLIWRSLIIKYSTLLLVGYGIYFSLGRQIYDSFENIMIFMIIQVFLSPFIIWCCFSYNRKEQASWIFKLGRGY